VQDSQASGSGTDFSQRSIETIIRDARKKAYQKPDWITDNQWRAVPSVGWWEYQKKESNT
jgi:hypothetical protein